MPRELTATASTTVHAGAAAVWDALVNPELIRRWMAGAEVESEWKPGSRIVWRGEWQGKRFEDHGTVVRAEPCRLLQFTHFSPLSGAPDVPENHHTVTIELQGEGERTLLSLSQDNNPTESAREHSERNWSGMLAALKQAVEDQVRQLAADLEGLPAPS
jgi:uncharacterized protein YndB with AHSA1/START domain